MFVVDLKGLGYKSLPHNLDNSKDKEKDYFWELDK
jgi:hypothetical protein